MVSFPGWQNQQFPQISFTKRVTCILKAQLSILTKPMFSNLWKSHKTGCSLIKTKVKYKLTSGKNTFKWSIFFVNKRRNVYLTYFYYCSSLSFFFFFPQLLKHAHVLYYLEARKKYWGVGWIIKGFIST